MRKSIVILLSFTMLSSVALADVDCFSPRDKYEDIFERFDTDELNVILDADIRLTRDSDGNYATSFKMADSGKVCQLSYPRHMIPRDYKLGYIIVEKSHNKTLRREGHNLYLDNIKVICHSKEIKNIAIRTSAVELLSVFGIRPTAKRCTVEEMNNVIKINYEVEENNVTEEIAI